MGKCTEGGQPAQLECTDAPPEFDPGPPPLCINKGEGMYSYQRQVEGGGIGNGRAKSLFNYQAQGAIL